MRSEPTEETWERMRFSMLPVKERIKIIEATPREIPRQVRKERVLLRFKEARARSRWVFRSNAMFIFSSF